jgi:hypothetical protein
VDSAPGLSRNGDPFPKREARRSPARQRDPVARDGPCVSKARQRWQLAFGLAERRSPSSIARIIVYLACPGRRRRSTRPDRRETGMRGMKAFASNETYMSRISEARSARVVRRQQPRHRRCPLLHPDRQLGGPYHGQSGAAKGSSGYRAVCWRRCPASRCRPQPAMLFSCRGEPIRIDFNGHGSGCAPARPET